MDIKDVHELGLVRVKTCGYFVSMNDELVRIAASYDIDNSQVADVMVIARKVAESLDVVDYEEAELVED